MPQHVPLDAMAALQGASKKMRTTALVVLEDGEKRIEDGAIDRLIELMSVTKSIVSLVIGQLVDRSLLKLDQSVSDFVPEWRGTPKEGISIQHVLEHTSGLADRRTTEEIYAADDFVAFAVAAELKHPPGEQFFYSNRASNLLALIVERAADQRLDVWAREHLLLPLGIEDFVWETDRTGNVQVMAGLHLSARSLARIGQLILDRGRCGGEQLISESWIDASTATYRRQQDGPRGLLWWIDPTSSERGFSRELFETWRASGVPETFIAKFIHLEGHYYPSGFESDSFLHAVQRALIGRDQALSDRLLRPYYAMTWKAGRRDSDVKYGEPRSVVADGWGGQLLQIVPSQRLVVARLREVTGPKDAMESKRFLQVVNEHLLGVKPMRPRWSVGLLALRIVIWIVKWVRRHIRSTR